MSERKQRVKEVLTGTGKVYEGESLICTVQYRLRVMQEYLVSRSLTESQEIPGIEEITGEIHVTDGERDLANGNTLVLKLDDGRRWKFYAASGDFISGDYHAVNADGAGIVTE